MKKIKLVLIILFSIILFSCKKEKEAETIELPSKPVVESVPKKQTDTINWYTELCEMNSSFDSNKYTKKQLKDTFQLWFGGNSYIDFDGYPVFNLDKKLDPIEKLENTYSERKIALENLEIVNLPYWQNIKKLRLKELKLYYENEKTAYFAYSNPAILLQTNYDKKAEIYVDALVSNDSLKMITAWRQLNEEQKAKNGSPENVEKKFQSMLNSNRCLEYAKMELFSFGWSNNVSRTTKDCEILSRTGDLHNEYLKLFISTEEECEEP